MSIFKDIALIGKASGTIGELQARVAELERQLQESTTAIASLKQQHERLTQEQKDTTEENEMLLTQLHQVQEELERYYLSYQDAKKECQSKERLINRVLLTNPRQFLYEGIECTRSSLYPERLHWKITDLFAARRHWDSLEFFTVIEGGIAGVIFSQDDEGRSPLVAWPAEFSECDELECIPTGNLENAKQRAKILDSLSASDWNLLSVIPELLVIAINDKRVGIENSEIYTQSLLRTLDILVNHIPQKLRFDCAELIGNVVHPGYEHLNIRLHNLTLGKIHYPKFEFRLGCANVTKQRFGTHPRLEFPLLDGKPPFESWFAESMDEFGEKWELRFVIPNSIDMETWKKLNTSDQILIRNLILSLSKITAMIFDQPKKIKRTSSDWQKLSDEVQVIFERFKSIARI